MSVYNILSYLEDRGRDTGKGSGGKGFHFSIWWMVGKRESVYAVTMDVQ